MGTYSSESETTREGDMAGTSDDNDRKPCAEHLECCEVGKGCVGARAIWIMAILSLAATVLCLYGLWAVWPSGTPATGSVTIVLFTRSFTVTDEQQILALVALAGALGGFVHLLRSFGRYVGNRQLR
jgi:hypothetical protein